MAGGVFFLLSILSILVTLQSEPPGADVSVESLDQPGWHREGKAEAPGGLQLKLEPGVFRVQARLRHFRTLTQVLRLGTSRRLKLALEAATARLEVATPGSDDTARGGELRVDGRLAGVVPVPVEVTAGHHVIEVRKRGYRPYQEPIDLETGEARTLWVALKAEVRTGSLLVKTAGAAQTVWVDGVARGATPLLLDNLAEGGHHVELRSCSHDGGPGGGVAWQQEVQVVAGQQAQVNR